LHSQPKREKTRQEQIDKTKCAAAKTENNLQDFISDDHCGFTSAELPMRGGHRSPKQTRQEVLWDLAKMRWLKGTTTAWRNKLPKSIDGPSICFKLFI